MPRTVRTANTGRAFALACALMLGWTATAGATSICGQIRRELNSATETIGNTAAVRAYQRAITEQQAEIAKVRRDLDRFRCRNGSILDFNAPNAGSCDMLSETLARMYDNLAVLKNHDTPLVSRSMSPKRRAQLLDALEKNGCNDVPDTPRRAALDAPTYNTSYSTDEVTPSVPPPSNQAEIRSLGGGNLGGNLQTVCVRTCDGGFFPISSNTSPASFARDAQVCSMMCPGVETELFYHGIGTQEMVDMVSASGGTPYKEEPYAFRFRDPNRKISKACSCNFSGYYRDMMKREAAQSPTSNTSEPNAIPETPAPRKRYSSVVNVDPAPNAREQATAKVEAPKPVDPPARPYDPTKNVVRQVGPQFLQDKDTAIDLRHPKTGSN